MITQNPQILVHDMEQVKAFTNIMPTLQDDEVYFLSLSARNKYLTDEERVEFDLGRTEMFSRHIAYDREGIPMALSRMEADLSVRTTRGGKEIPRKCLVVYMNIHPSSTVTAYTKLKAQLDNHFNETYRAVKNRKGENYEPFLRMRTHMMNHIQRATSRRLWVDIDIDHSKLHEDSIEFKQYAKFYYTLSLFDIEFHEIITQGGVHVLVNKESLAEAPKELQLFKQVSDLHDTLKVSGGEAKFNNNAMVPLPGTYQAGVPVTIRTGSIA